MIRMCEKCGLPPDLCACEEREIEVKRLGIMSTHRIYYCTKCRKEVSYSQTETFFCPCCGRSGMRHKGTCQGVVIEKDPHKIPILY